MRVTRVELSDEFKQGFYFVDRIKVMPVNYIKNDNSRLPIVWKKVGKYINNSLKEEIALYGKNK